MSAQGRFRFVAGPELGGYELAPDHPFKPVRFELTSSLLTASGLLAQGEVIPAAALPRDALLEVHDRDYVAAAERLSVPGSVATPEDAARFGLGTPDNPVFPGMHEKVASVCAATATAVELVASGSARRAASFAGGLHHALRGRASGFCVYNDLAIAIKRAVERHGVKVAYLDVDAHHGDGVQALFYDDPRVMTISLHESGTYLFPGTGHTYETGVGAGRGSAVNAPLEPFTEDDSFLEVFDLVVGPSLRRFRPDLIVLQAGADMHRFDPLADLSLSLVGMAASYARTVALADELCEGRLVITGGGGYDPYRTVPRAWASAWAALSGRTLPRELPDAWLARWRPRFAAELPESFAEDPSGWPVIERRSAIAARNRTVAVRLMESLEQIWDDVQGSAAGGAGATGSRRRGAAGD